MMNYRSRVSMAVCACAVASSLVISCGDDSRSSASASAQAAGSHTNGTIMPARTIEVFVDREPAKPYFIIAIHRYPAPTNTGAEVDSLKRQAYDEGGDAILLKVRSEALARTDIDAQSLLEVQVLAWKKP
jgi:hypothetical protein